MSDRFPEQAELIASNFLAIRIKDILNGRQDAEKDLILSKGIEILESAKRGLTYVLQQCEGGIKLKDLSNYHVTFSYFKIVKPELLTPYIDTLKSFSEGKHCDPVYKNKLIGFWEYLQKMNNERISNLNHLVGDD